MIANNWSCDVIRAYSVKTVLNELTLRVIAQKRYPCVQRESSVRVALRVIAQKQSRDVPRLQRERSVDTSTNFARESVKPDSLLEPCYARGSTTAVSSPAPCVVACNSVFS